MHHYSVEPLEMYIFPRCPYAYNKPLLRKRTCSIKEVSLYIFKGVFRERLTAFTYIWSNKKRIGLTRCLMKLSAGLAGA